ncbi:PD-(D/E)XK nuclease family protein [Holophaga foetida]|uniref:PD-(D/E)XK nuclease family protein n=1 Tax=Holophaga foetida TaxID=35839 RepID=UPI000247429E
MKPLPAPLESFRARRYFSPSRWQDLKSCPLRAFARGGILPDSLESVAGTFLHEVRHMLLAKGEVGPSMREEARARLRSMTEDREAELAGNPEYATLVPFVSSFGRLKWAAKAAGLLDWARNAAPLAYSPPAGKGFLGCGEQDPDSVRADSFAVGAEVTWVCNSLRLAGRVDEARELSDGSILITDYKSGVLPDEEGRIPDHMVWQMWMYLLMAESLTGKPAAAVLQGGWGRLQVPWCDAERERAKTALLHSAAIFPVGSKLDAQQYATPGSVCVGCRQRPACPAYLQSAPKWWPNRSGQPRPIPFDTWGAPCGAPGAGGVRIVTVNGLESIIRWLPPTLDLGTMDPGDRLFAFDLQPTSEIRMHGMRLHPQAFHADWPNRQKPRALQPRFFIQKG